MRKTLIVLAALAGFAGQARAQPDPVVTARGGYELRLLGGGLTAGQRGLHSYPVFQFGISRGEALRRVSALRGPTSAAGSRACAGRSLGFARFGTLTLWFRGDRWVGWLLSGPPGRRPIRTEWGMGIGTLRGEIGDADTDQPQFRQTAGGSEFSFEGMQGLLAGRGRRARISELRSGTTCRR